MSDTTSAWPATGRRPSPDSSHSVLVELRGVEKSFESPAGTTAALCGVDLEVDRGEYLAIVGRSGSGKSTLLNLIAGIDRPTSGSVSVAGTAVHALGEGPLARWRGENVGVVFQFFQLMPTLTVAENVMLPMDFRGRPPARERKRRALELLDRVGIAGHADKFPATLSGGEQQRVAIARALANDPPLIVADEPTGNLDSRTAADIHRLFEELAAAGRTVIVVTHERTKDWGFSRVVQIADGLIESSSVEV
ncbi:MAG: ABC transporter ATP-binding protein [bacterium]|nr:ABC transporter ATP-binding protein [bacterium]MCP5066486.1 ABC transporter ATP-binding protein [bacterium]